MVSSVTSSALSGLSAASKRVQVAANNISNGLTVGKPNSTDPSEQAYKAQEVQQSTGEFGGVQTRVIERDPATQTAYNPNSPLADSSGLVETPNVDLGEEMVNMITAESSYKANAAVLRTNEDLEREVLDIVS